MRERRLGPKDAVCGGSPAGAAVITRIIIVIMPAVLGAAGGGALIHTAAGLLSHGCAAALGDFVRFGGIDYDRAATSCAIKNTFILLVHAVPPF